MLGDMLLTTLQLCGIIIVVGLTAAFISELIDSFFGKKK